VIAELLVGCHLSSTHKHGWHENINDIYNDSIIFSSENIMIFLTFSIFLIFSIFSKYPPLLLLFTYFSHSCISNTNCQVTNLLDAACKNIDENFNPLGRAQTGATTSQTTDADGRLMP